MEKPESAARKAQKAGVTNAAYESSDEKNSSHEVSSLPGFSLTRTAPLLTVCVCTYFSPPLTGVGRSAGRATSLWSAGRGSN